MRVELGINPNCSELVIRIGNIDVDEIREKLSEHGFEEALIRDFYGLGEDKPMDWDDNSNVERMTMVKDLPATVATLMKARNSHDEKIQDKAEKALRKLGYTDTWYNFDLVHADYPPDYLHGSSVSLRSDFEGEGPAIIAHQHCQTQLYPILYKISKIFHEDVEGYDGGTNQTYNEWLNAGRPDVKTWEPEE